MRKDTETERKEEPRQARARTEDVKVRARDTVG